MFDSRSARFVALLSIFVLVASCSNAASKASPGDSASSGEVATQGLPALAQSEFVDMTAQAEVTVIAKDNVFSPQYITISPGTKVIFVNRGRNPHNVIPVQASQFEQIATDDLRPDDQAPLVLDEPGMYPYYCSLHGTPKKGMNGRIQVAAE